MERDKIGKWGAVRGKSENFDREMGRREEIYIDRSRCVGLGDRSFCGEDELT